MIATLFLLCLPPAAADDTPPAVPPTREAMKRALEDSKHVAPRLPLPPLTEEEKAREAEGRSGSPAGGGQGRSGLGGGIVNNGRMRKHYLPAGVLAGGFSREPDPAMTLGYAFQTRLFWIVSRGNNCTYCMGHQEVKLSAAGMTEDQIAALDGEWSEFDARDQAAFAFTRKLTFEPHAMADADVAALRDAGFDDAQILEIVHSVGGFNAMNRWTGVLRIPQEDHRDYNGPVSAKARGRKSTVAPIADDGSPTAAPSRRPALETAAEVEAALSEARTRTPRIALVEESEARRLLPNEGADTPLPGWTRLLARFPKNGPVRIAMHRSAETEGVLDPRHKAMIAYVAARHDRAWYALDLARRQLAALGITPEQLAALDEMSRPLTADERALVADARSRGRKDETSAGLPVDRLVAAFARKLTTDPARIDDADVDGLRGYFTDHQVAEIVFQVTEAAYFDRLTEAAGLPLDP